jgi:uncharacterized protein YcbX
LTSAHAGASYVSTHISRATPPPLTSAHAGASFISARTSRATPPSLTRRAAASDAAAVATVTHLHRFAVKGLDRDSLDRVALRPGDAFPLDRTWALIKAGRAHLFDPSALRWVHKQEFLCSFTANELMATFDSCLDDATRTLTVCRRGDPPGVEPLLREPLDDDAGRARVSAFFSEAAGEPVALVRASADGGRAHQFGNTGSGLKAGSGDVRTIHLVNAATVADLAAAARAPLHARRFRANVIVDGLPPWREFDWVGRTVRLGGARLNVIKRTVRCAGVNVDPRDERGAREDLDIPALLTAHFPQHGPYLGVYAQVVSAGEVCVGDVVRVEEDAEPGARQVMVN